VDENLDLIERGAPDFTELTANLVAAYVSNNHIQPVEIGTLIASTHAALTGLGAPSASSAPVAEKLTPAQIRKSITPDALISFLDGKPYKTLKRHLNGNGMTIEQYRERFGLPVDYPSTAASYSALRSEMAHKIGLGNQRRNVAPKAAELEATVSDKPKRGGRPRKTKEPAGV
jgi:predicted transcriptional regulator